VEKVALRLTYSLKINNAEFNVKVRKYLNTKETRARYQCTSRTTMIAFRPHAAHARCGITISRFTPMQGIARWC